MELGKSPKKLKSSNITNLSSKFRLTNMEQQLLEKGLTYIPTPKLIDKKDLKRDLFLYHRRLKLLDYFGFHNQFRSLPFTDKSNWSPAEGLLSPAVKELIIKDKEIFGEARPKVASRLNLKPEELKALHSLKRNQDIVIKPADKGSQIVIMDRSDYIKEAMRQLTNSKHYIPLAHSIQTQSAALFKLVLQDMKDNGYITHKQFCYLLGPNPPRARQFYLLPKIHKPPHTWTVPGIIPPGRPIVSDCSSESYRIAEYIDAAINPLSQNHKSYIKDTYDFINKLELLTVPETSFLFSIDITSLYTNIDTHLGLQAVAQIFRENPDRNRPDQALLKLLELSLTRNDFVFNDRFYLQIHGTAMGKKFAPAYANLYMKMWEESVFEKCLQLPLVYYRYLDDIFGIWPYSKEEFATFIEVLNAHHTAIKVTANLQEHQIQFLDTEVFFIRHEERDTKSLGTRVFFKDTDRHALLHKTSFHPKHTFKGIIKSQLIRFNRICTYQKDVEIATRTLFRALRPRGYTKRFLRQIKKEVREELGTIKQIKKNNKKSQKNTHLVPFVTTFSNLSRPIVMGLKKNFNEWKKERPNWQDCQVLPAYRRNKNLGDILVHSKLRALKQKESVLEWTPTAIFKPLPILTNIFSKLSRPILQDISLDTINVIYGLRCRHCQRIYIGETGRMLKARLKQHIYEITKGKATEYLYVHFREQGIENLQAFGLQSNITWSQLQRRRNERIWIKSLKTLRPYGLNDR
ncbi:uncharacterized protein LOC130908814 isoform X3 [Corythoichthys intestinalis]|uniref:uncharacterized protein LOC130908814 isoform X3 n=1 Tax=Corythoichthys intestinalis TaxID=161448 RepID=UPI0025A58467|nr:uncharacterized protein LOC130908814 isoform X3 [Corythoichthys intestinalis]XP_057680613.1 uncharacterized protein LOC130908814 isoform X4 [Corythoichthys intestinalis]XP_057680615.1 uncharacterized protein LOC130908814 isoform X4 [Corythoichthys intestinalis]XP_057680616.1 uncharacterized protein LOC130908814 isoform X4 [Corythoichthys intestinalis]XP_057680617.1 uncharacterized protein LOC130908814 isoform X4 [Corythoichthys intestinalis]XP_057680618.1 uncharacterized protein LOC13090881